MSMERNTWQSRLVKQNIWIYTILKHTKYREDQHLIVLNLGSISIDKILVPEFMNVKVSKNLNLMKKNANTVRSTTSNTQINTKHTKKNRLQKNQARKPKVSGSSPAASYVQRWALCSNRTANV